MSKEVRRGKTPKDHKTTRVDKKNDPGRRASCIPSWQFEVLDLNGPWCPKNTLDVSDFWSNVLPKLCAFEGMNWAQIESAGSHEVLVQKIIPDARRRLEDIKQSDIHSLFSLRLSGEQRIWGIRFGSVLKMLWWDPKHQICPSARK